MWNQTFILTILGLALISNIYGFSLDHRHSHVHVHPDPPHYDLPAPPTPQAPPTPGAVEPLCGCTEKGRCGESLRSFTDLVIRTHASEVVCGSQAELCCYEHDPWPGYKDQFGHLAPCVPDDICRRPYGVSPTDIRDYGAIGPCPGLGAVRCLDGLEAAVPPPPPVPEGPTHIVIPIIENPVPHDPPVYYTPPVTEPPTTTEVPTTTPTIPTSTGYVYPEPPVVYQPPQSVPPTVYEPPVVYQPPQSEPPTVYAPPEPEPEPPLVYAPPHAEPEVPPVSYGPPTPIDYYAPPASEPDTPSPPATSYGVPGLPQGEPLGYAYTSRFGYPYGYSRYGGYYPGLRFRLRKYFGGISFLG